LIDDAHEIQNADADKMTAADIVRMAAQIAAMADPTGVAGVIENFSYPKCTELFQF